MRLPSVIDNRDHKLGDILNELLRRYQHRSMDIATAYFSVGGREYGVLNGVMREQQSPRATGYT